MKRGRDEDERQAGPAAASPPPRRHPGPRPRTWRPVRCAGFTARRNHASLASVRTVLFSSPS